MKSSSDHAALATAADLADCTACTPLASSSSSCCSFSSVSLSSTPAVSTGQASAQASVVSRLPMGVIQRTSTATRSCARRREGTRVAIQLDNRKPSRGRHRRRRGRSGVGATIERHGTPRDRLDPCSEPSSQRRHGVAPGQHAAQNTRTAFRESKRRECSLATKLGQVACFLGRPSRDAHRRIDWPTHFFRMASCAELLLEHVWKDGDSNVKRDPN